MWGLKYEGKGGKIIQFLSDRWKLSFPSPLSCLLENLSYVEGDLLSPSSPPELREIQLTHLMTDRLQHEQIVLELAPEKTVTRRVQARLR